MRDGVRLARRNVPAIALVTEAFTEQGNFVARSVGLPGVPRLEMPHPVAGSGVENLSRVARQIAPRIVELLRGTP